MLRVITEEPITYQKSLDVEKSDSWIYKNPTKKEVDELLERYKEIRILIHKNDYYIACAYFYTHYLMQTCIGGIEGISFGDYDEAFSINIQDGIIDGDRVYNDRKGFYNLLNKLYPKLSEVGLLNKNMVVEFGSEEGKEGLKVPLINLIKENRLIEEPVSIKPENEILINNRYDIEDYYIYKNPTLYEVNKLFKIDGMVRILLLGNDYYIGSGALYTHHDMAKLLYDYNKTNYRNYDGYFVRDKEDDSLYEMGDKSNCYNQLKEVLPLMVETKLVDLDTIICPYSSACKIVSYGVQTVEDLINLDF